MSFGGGVLSGLSGLSGGGSVCGGEMSRCGGEGLRRPIAVSYIHRPHTPGTPIGANLAPSVGASQGPPARIVTMEGAHADCDNWHEEALTMQQMTGMTQPQASSVRSSLNRSISFSCFELSQTEIEIVV